MDGLGRPRYEVADVIRQYGAAFLATHPQPKEHLRTLSALERCRTAALGGHVEECSSCGHPRISYNSCRNRHCPKCQGLDRDKWVQAREAELLPVPYFHVVFTLPHELNGLCLIQPRVLYNLLFQATWETIDTFAKDPTHLGAQTGMTAVLHTWGQNLSLHPHLHCIVPAGGLTQEEQWKHAKGKGNFLFPVKAMSQVFKAKFLAGLRKLYQRKKLVFIGEATSLASPLSFQRLLAQLYQKKWVVYAKKPFAQPQHVIQYLGRYTHRVAITNHRIQSIKDGKVSFLCKNYRKQGKKECLALTATEFLRRFCLHILPPQFVRIRHYGIYASRHKQQALKQARKALDVTEKPAVEKKNWKQRLREATGVEVDKCPACKVGRMRTVEVLAKGRSPPKQLISPQHPSPSLICA